MANRNLGHLIIPEALADRLEAEAARISARTGASRIATIRALLDDALSVREKEAAAPRRDDLGAVVNLADRTF